MTAAAARLAGLSCVLVLATTESDPRPQGNLLLDRLFGAEVHLVPPGPDLVSPNPHEEACIAGIVDHLLRQGHRPYQIPVGGSTPLGTLGYVDAMRELQRQLTELHASPTRVYYAAGSRGTQAGIVLGQMLEGADWVPHGIAVSPGDPAKTLRAVGLVMGAAALLGREVHCAAQDVITHQEYIGTAYGAPTPEADDAVRLLARTETLLLDPVYTGKAMAGLLDHIARRAIHPNETVVFIHTGGVPAVFSHADRLAVSTSNHLVMPKLVAPTAPNAAHVHVTWAGGLRFDAGRPAGPVARIDGSAETGQGPLDAILSALAICAATDILEILEKRRTPAGRFTADVVGERVETVPRRLRRIDLHYTIDGPDIDRGHAERAVDLALTKYCSVRGSLDPAIPITFVVTLNNERGTRRQAARVATRGEARSLPTCPVCNPERSRSPRDAAVT